MNKKNCLVAVNLIFIIGFLRFLNKNLPYKIINFVTLFLWSSSCLLHTLQDKRYIENSLNYSIGKNNVNIIVNINMYI